MLYVVRPCVLPFHCLVRWFCLSFPFSRLRSFFLQSSLHVILTPFAPIQFVLSLCRASFLPFLLHASLSSVLTLVRPSVSSSTIPPYFVICFVIAFLRSSILLCFVVCPAFALPSVFPSCISSLVHPYVLSLFLPLSIYTYTYRPSCRSHLCLPFSFSSFRLVFIALCLHCFVRPSCFLL